MPETIVVSVSAKDQKNQARRKEVQHLLSGEKGPLSCQGVCALYRLEGNVSGSQADWIVRELLSDPVVETYHINDEPAEHGTIFADVWPKPGVADPVGGSVLKAIRDLGVSTLNQASSGTRYIFTSKQADLNGKNRDEALVFANRELLNPLIQECRIRQK